MITKDNPYSDPFRCLYQNQNLIGKSFDNWVKFIF